MENKHLDLPSPMRAGRIVTMHLLYWIIFSSILPIILPMILYYYFGVPFKLLNLTFMWLDYLACSLLAMLIAVPLLRDDFKEFHLSKAFSTAVFSILAMLAFNVVFSLLMYNLGLSVESSNEQALDAMANLNSPMYVMMVVVYAPILEELVFRGAIFRPIRGKFGFWPAAIVSSLLFGFIHVSSSLLSGDLSELLYLILYSCLGLFMANAYERNQSIYGSILLHMIYNLVAVTAGVALFMV